MNATSPLRPRLPIFERVRRMKTALRIAHLRESHARARLELSMRAAETYEDARGLVLKFRERSESWMNRRFDLEFKLQCLEEHDSWFADSDPPRHPADCACAFCDEINRQIDENIDTEDGGTDDGTDWQP